ncbi:MAG: hypothetical protein N2449_09295 [Bacteroidales bacterium]|nr:hypothetical protein [Bacteroidales bacterium]
MYTYRKGIELLTVWELPLLVFYIFLFLVYTYVIRLRKIEKQPEYKYFIPGFFAKIFGGLAFIAVYIFYYGEGDTTHYFQSCESLLNLAFKDFWKFASILIGNLTNENASLFGPEIGYAYYYNDPNSYAVVRFTIPFIILGGKSFVATTILISAFTFSGLWKLFRLLVKIFPQNIKTNAFAVLFIPSTLFWGSGLLKDSYTLMATCYFFVSFYQIIVLRKEIPKHLFLLLFSTYVLLSIKPYILFALTAAALVTFIHANMKIIQNKILKTILFPIIVLIVFLIGTNIILSTGELAGGYYSSLDKMLKQAVEIQQDLTKEYYGGNSFNIGKFDPTFTGILSKAHLAIIAGLYRPFYWEAKNIAMLVAATENFIFLFLTFYVILLSFLTWRKHGFSYMQKVVLSDSFIVFSLIFSIMFSFFIGLTTANFGALVRYKIPLIPFFMASLFIIIKNFNIEKLSDNQSIGQ